MADGDLRVIVKAKELAKQSFILTSNNNRYPKKYRHSLVDKIQIKSLEIHDTLLEANTINNITHKRLRCETITKAITLCNQLLFFRLFEQKKSYLFGKMLIGRCFKHICTAKIFILHCSFLNLCIL